MNGEISEDDYRIGDVDGANEGTTILNEFDLVECNPMDGMPWVHYEKNGEHFQEPVIVSFRDIFILFHNEGVEPDDEHDGRYHFTKTRVELGANFGIEIGEAFFTARAMHIVK